MISAETHLTRRDKLLFVCLTVITALWWNWRFVSKCTEVDVRAMNDVGGILTGFAQTPNLLIDGVKWWHGPWIQDGIQTLRPVSSYLLWIESFVGLKWGFFWVGCIGMMLLIANCLIGAALAWRFTRSKFCTAFSAALAPTLWVWNFGGAQPDYWLAWYPVHQDLWMIGCLLGALLSFDVWIESGQPKYLGATWACFIIGALSKEFVYIFPVMAALLSMRQRQVRTITPRVALRQAALMLGLSIGLYCYRTIVLSNAYNPPRLKRVHFLRKPFLYWFGPLYGYVLSDQSWFPGLGLLLLGLSGALLRLLRTQCDWLQRRFAWLLVALGVGGVIALYCQFVGPSLEEVFWHFFEPEHMLLRLSFLAQAIALFYTLHLIWKYRHTEPSLVAWALMAVSYVPVFTYLGWHYTLAGAFLRAAIYWPLVLKLVWRDLSKYFEPLFMRLTATHFITAPSSADPV